MLSPLVIKGEIYSVTVIQPRPFQGTFRSGGLLPNGDVVLKVKKSADQPAQKMNITLPLAEPLNLSEDRFMPARPKLEGKGLVEDSPNLLSITPPKTQRTPLFVSTPQAPRSKISKIPGYVLSVLGVGLIGTGVYFYTLREKDVISFDKEYPGEGGFPAYFWIPGLAFSGIGAGWLWWTW